MNSFPTIPTDRFSTWLLSAVPGPFPPCLFRVSNPGSSPPEASFEAGVPAYSYSYPTRHHCSRCAGGLWQIGRAWLDRRPFLHQAPANPYSIREGTRDFNFSLYIRKLRFFKFGPEAYSAPEGGINAVWQENAPFGHTLEDFRVFKRFQGTRIRRREVGGNGSTGPFFSKGLVGGFRIRAAG